LDQSDPAILGIADSCCVSNKVSGYPTIHIYYSDLGFYGRNCWAVDSPEDLLERLLKSAHLLQRRFLAVTT
jgi:hypothetical protein